MSRKKIMRYKSTILVAISEDLRALHLNSNVPFRLYLAFQLKDLPENSYIAIWRMH